MADDSANAALAVQSVSLAGIVRGPNSMFGSFKGAKSDRVEGGRSKQRSEHSRMSASISGVPIPALASPPRKLDPKLDSMDYTYTTSRRLFRMASPTFGGDIMSDLVHAYNAPKQKARTKSAVSAAAWKAYGSPKTRGMQAETPAPDRMHPKINPSVMEAMPGHPTPTLTLGGGYQVAGAQSQSLRPQTAPSGRHKQHTSYFVGPKIQAPPVMRRPVTASQYGQQGTRTDEEFRFSETLPTDPMALIAWQEVQRRNASSLVQPAARDVSPPGPSGRPAPRARPSSAPMPKARPNSGQRARSGRAATRTERFASSTLLSIKEQRSNFRPQIVTGFSVPEEEIILPNADDSAWTYSRASQGTLSSVCNNLKIDPARPFSASYAQRSLSPACAALLLRGNLTEWYAKGVRDPSFFDQAHELAASMELVPEPRFVPKLRLVIPNHAFVKSDPPTVEEVKAEIASLLLELNAIEMEDGPDAVDEALSPNVRAGAPPSPRVPTLLLVVDEEDGFVQEDNGEGDEMEAAISRASRAVASGSKRCSIAAQHAQSPFMPPPPPMLRPEDQHAADNADPFVSTVSVRHFSSPLAATRECIEEEDASIRPATDLRTSGLGSSLAGRRASSDLDDDYEAGEGEQSADSDVLGVQEDDGEGGGLEGLPDIDDAFGALPRSSSGRPSSARPVSARPAGRPTPSRTCSAAVAGMSVIPETVHEN